MSKLTAKKIAMTIEVTPLDQVVSIFCQNISILSREPPCYENPIYVLIPFLGIARPQPQFPH